MRDRRTIFLDLDGVIVDNGGPLQEAYRLAVAEALHARFGGDVEAWGEANLEAFRRGIPPPPELKPVDAYRWEDTVGVRWPCEILGVTPPDDDECARIGFEINRRVRLELSELFPWTGEAIRSLSTQRDVHMASGNAAWVVEGVLGRLGVRDAVGLPCGADLVGVRKDGAGFYPALFALAGAHGSEAIVVDDSVAPLQAAARVGAATVLVARDGPDEVEDVDLVVPSLAAFVEVMVA